MYQKTKKHIGGRGVGGGGRARREKLHDLYVYTTKGVSEGEQKTYFVDFFWGGEKKHVVTDEGMRRH